MSTNTFLVRNAASRQIVGLFCARRSNELFSLLDERVDPFECEYLELVSGEGLFCGDTGTQTSEALAARRRSAAWRALDLAGFEPRAGRASACAPRLRRGDLSVS
jgi:hypothetical protein